VRARALGATLALVAIGCALPGAAQAALEVSGFALTPSSTQAGGHPDVRVAISFARPETGIKDIALHLPAGLRLNARAAPFCKRKRLLADLCARRTRVGSLTAVGEVFGLELSVTRRIYNVAPTAGEPVRLGVPIYGTFSRPGFAAELPLTMRPDGGLDMRISGLPRDVNGISVGISEIRFSLRGIVRVRVRKRVRSHAFVTAPAACVPATTVLELSSHDEPAPVTLASSFTPTGC
jgi:hypothetical protein